MGIENREYMREDDSLFRRVHGSTSRDIVVILVIINVVVHFAQHAFRTPMSMQEFASRVQGIPAEEIPEVYQQALEQRMLPDSSVVNEWGALDPRKVLRGQIWRPLTAAFLHSTDSARHIFWNMFLLFLVGRRLADHLGQREFLWFYLFAAYASNLFQVLWFGITDQMQHQALGASGAVAAAMMVYALNWPRQQWLLFFVIPVPVIALVIFNAATDLIPMFGELTRSGPGDGIAHAAHIGGMLFGLAYFYRRWRVTDWLEVFSGLQFNRLFHRRPKLRVHNPEAESTPPGRPSISLRDQSRMDQLLAKINDKGIDSLSDEERRFLDETSRTLRGQ